MSSSAFSLSAMFASPAFEVIEGEPVIGGLHGDDTHHFFCPHCMTWMFTRPVAVAHIVNVRPTMFDDHAWFLPFMETFTRTRLAWAKTGAERSFDELPPMDAYEGLMREFANANA